MSERLAHHIHEPPTVISSSAFALIDTTIIFVHLLTSVNAKDTNVFPKPQSKNRPYLCLSLNLSTMFFWNGNSVV